MSDPREVTELPCAEMANPFQMNLLCTPRGSLPSFVDGLVPDNDGRIGDWCHEQIFRRALKIAKSGRR